MYLLKMLIISYIITIETILKKVYIVLIHAVNTHIFPMVPQMSSFALFFFSAWEGMISNV